MDIAALALMIPISAIVLGVGGGIIQSILKSQERRLELRLRAQQGQNEDVTRQIEALRVELAALRDTTTQYDLTNDHVVQRLEERLGRLETRSAVTSVSMPEEPPVQRLNSRG